MKRKTKRNIFENYYSAITGKPVAKDTRTKPDVKSGDRESVVLRECMSYLKSVGVQAKRNNTGFGNLGSGRMYQYGIRHAGDIICNINGRYTEIECKHGSGGTWSAEQQRHADDVRSHGGLYFLVHSVDELRKFIEPLLNRIDFETL
jgi:hypothetical protein